MAMLDGEIYRCPNPDCGCEIQVVKGMESEGMSSALPRCCCGTDMELMDFEELPLVDEGQGESRM
jgi:hypothetical protein